MKMNKSAMAGMKMGSKGARAESTPTTPAATPTPSPTPPGELSPADKKMLKMMLQPDPMPMAPADRRHAFIMVGTKTLFLVHMTMFHMEEHCYQIVLRAQLPEAVMKQFREWRRKKPKQAYFLANLTESAMDVPQLASGQLTEFEAEIFEGIPESSPPGAPKGQYNVWPWTQPPAIAKVRVTVERVVYFRHFDFNFEYPKYLTYVLFGSGKEAHMQSYQTKEPDYDHVLSLETAPAWLPADKLESAVTVSFPKEPSRPVRLKNPLTRKDYQVQYQGFWEYLGYRFTKLHPLALGTTWWFSNSPLNLVPPVAPKKQARRK
jgi:hypothetical protein